MPDVKVLSMEEAEKSMYFDADWTREQLQHTSIDDAVHAFLDMAPKACLTLLRVYCFDREVIDADLQAEAVESLLCNLEENTFVDLQVDDIGMFDSQEKLAVVKKAAADFMKVYAEPPSQSPPSTAPMVARPRSSRPSSTSTRQSRRTQYHPTGAPNRSDRNSSTQ